MKKVAGLALITFGLLGITIGIVNFLAGAIILGGLFAFQCYLYLSEASHVDIATVLDTTDIEIPTRLYDEEKRKALVSELKRMTPPKLVSLHAFFDGNIDDRNSIGCNLYPEHPGIDVFRNVLEDLQRRADVDDVLVQVMEDVPDEESWPYSDRVIVIGQISTRQLELALREIGPVDLGEAGQNLAKVILNQKPMSGSLVKEVVWD